MPLLETKGAASAQGYGLTVGAAAEPVYVEDVMSTFLYTGNGSTQTINNGIDLAGEGGLVWLKSRSLATNHFLFDTNRGALNEINSNATEAQASLANSLTAFNANGFSVGSAAGINVNAATYASWTFREQPKFFDVVTYTGTGSARTIAHNLGSAPGVVIVKSTDGAGQNWCVYHRSAGAGNYLYLNTTAAQNADTSIWNNTAPTSSVFSVGGDGYNVNDSGFNYVAYLFAHNAGGFGLSGEDNVISCGSYTGAGASTTVTLGYEPQWILIKRTNTTGPWHLQDVMRGATVSATDNGVLYPNTSQAEQQKGSHVFPTATGFAFTASEDDINASGSTYIYIAIRRGPMKTPTTGTSVFAVDKWTISGGADSYPMNVQVVDSLWWKPTSVATGWAQADRLRGKVYLASQSTAAEVSNTNIGFDGDQYSSPPAQKVFLTSLTGTSDSQALYAFRRAPGFFDEVCYTGDSSGTKAISHNLGVAPELYIVKGRTGSPTYGWYVYSAALGNTKSLVLNTTAAEATTSWTWGNTSPTASAFYVTSDDTVGGAGRTYVAYLFASCPGVSKVGSYTGTGTTQVINCGFTAGSRFIMIKRTDSTGDWFVWDSARGIVAGNDPYLLLNSTAAEVTNTDFVDTAATGFEISSTAPAAINANGGTYIFLAIA